MIERILIQRSVVVHRKLEIGRILTEVLILVLSGCFEFENKLYMA